MIGIPVEPFADGLIEAVFAEGLEQVVDGVSLEGLDGIFIEGGGEDDIGRIVHELQHFEAIDLRHLDVQEDKIGVVLLDRFDAFETVVAFLQHGDVGVGLKIFLNDHPREGFVIDDNGPDGAGASGGGRVGVTLSVCHCGIFTMVMKRLLSTRVSSRSGRVNNR